MIFDGPKNIVWMSKKYVLTKNYKMKQIMNSNNTKPDISSQYLSLISSQLAVPAGCDAARITVKNISSMWSSFTLNSSY